MIHRLLAIGTLLGLGLLAGWWFALGLDFYRAGDLRAALFASGGALAAATGVYLLGATMEAQEDRHDDHTETEDR